MFSLIEWRYLGITLSCGIVHLVHLVYLVAHPIYCLDYIPGYKWNK